MHFNRIEFWFSFTQTTFNLSKLEDADNLSLDGEDLLSFSFQVAKGMEYITSKNVGLPATHTLMAWLRKLQRVLCCVTAKAGARGILAL